MQPTAPTSADRFHQNISGILALFLSIGAAYCRMVAKSEDWADFLAYASVALAGYCGGHFKGSQTSPDPPKT